MTGPAPIALPRRLRLAGVALLCVAMQGASVGHLLLTPHVVCPVHGELVDSDGDHGAALTVESAEPAPHGVTISQAHTAGSAEHADEHCAVLASRREHAIVAPASSSLIYLAADEALASPPATRASLAGRAGYDVAPKQSPPV